MVANAFLTALGAPVWRATLMLALYLGARLLYREKSMLNAIGAAALGLMIVNPRVLFGASFQLTFLCVWLVAAVGIPVLERTTLPFVRASRHADSTSYDYVLPPSVVQFRLDLRMIAGRLQRFLGLRFPLPALAVCSRAVAWRLRVADHFRDYADWPGIADGVLLSSRNSGGTTRQHAGSAVDGDSDAGRHIRDGAGLCFGCSGQNSGVDCRSRARGNCRHRALVGRAARRRSPCAHAWNCGHHIVRAVDRVSHGARCAAVPCSRLLDWPLWVRAHSGFPWSGRILRFVRLCWR